MIPHPYFSVLSVPVSSYFLLVSVAVTMCSAWFIRRTERRSLSRLTAIDLTLTVLVAGFAGARLLHVFYEDPAFYRAQPWAILQFWYGGFVYLGGAVSAVLAAWIFCAVRSQPFWFWADLAAPPVALGYALGRIGCLLNGCCYGKVCPATWWAVTVHGFSRYPTQALAAAGEGLIVLLLLKIEPRVRMAGTLFAVWLVLHALNRVAMEFFRDDPRGPLAFGIMSLGTAMSLGLGLLGVLIIALKPGHKRLV